jgi:RimJ/RimL family protein N-acetyltransferase
MRPVNTDTYFWQDDRIRFRAMRSDDWEPLYANRFDTPARLLLDYLVELPPTEAEVRAFVDEHLDFGNAAVRLMFSIETLEGEWIGGLNLGGIDERNGTFGIGLQVDRDHRAEGYGTAAMRIALRYASFQRRLHKFNVSVLEGNVGSTRMLQKLGCVQEGVRRQVVYANGRYHDEILFGLTADEFLAANDIENHA